MSGYTGRTGPNGASGERATATAVARSDPATTAPITPTNPSAMAMPGPAPRARTTAPSSLLRRTSRPITWPLITSAANAAMSPKSPIAMASGRMVRSAFATYGAHVVEPPTGPRLGTTLFTAETTAA